ncbi:MAG: type IIA DNA topoisomerase subunit B [Candidatus Nanopelagicales bacterium]|nr:type IIA DNA topoisomerase subunit B [Candidatus Nanopelagicales bacterium]MDP4864482.1 type IIA DNA topoisomerase subunit B [Candidatus Nanopelagicaceae bacterium]MDP4652791.1 type IIA DNA topoisomerase subunit B [Candidatus Nanopelagicales bacterium]MDP4750808.1 type IIA DNA topoisomerase subunit B [Candidatus Nanopelagicales bacterium]MDP4931043.1 type IIA DNA topoisomerase subunit B [Candidatus Nanopelagicaceae bacterium]
MAETQSADQVRSVEKSYSAKDLSVLEGLDAVRKRPGMYIGSTDGRGLMHCLWEIIDNAVDESLAGYCKKIEINLEKDGSIEVHDDGRGIPVDKEPKTGLTGVEVVMTRLHAGGKFGGGSYAATGGLHGVGASVVNALASRLDVEVDRDGKIYWMSFKRGVAGIFDGDGPNAPFEPKSGLRIIGKVSAKITGTRIKWWSDKQIFLKDAQHDLEEIYTRARQTSYLVPGLTLIVNDNRSKEKSSETFFHKGGISEYCHFIQPDEAVGDVIRLTGEGHYQETVPVLDEKGHLEPQEVERDMGVDIAIKWGNGYESTVRSFVNIIATPKGGTHVQGFEKALVKTFNEFLRAKGVLKKNELDVIKEDIIEGLTAVVTVRMQEPQFEGQTKEVLGTPAVTKIVTQVVSDELKKFFTTTKRIDKANGLIVLEKVANASRTRISSRAHKELQRRKNALESSSLPAKLSDCRSEDVSRTELFIVEGESALGTTKAARNSEFQAILPLKGKILNVQKASLSQMLDNAECAAIIQVIGAGSGKSFTLEDARYGRVILMSDADVDGAHIRCLMLTLLYRYMKPLIDDGRVFAAIPPLHRIEVIGGGGKKGEVHYTYSDDDMKKLLTELKKQGKRWKEPLQRYKGLGEMDADQLRETTMDPDKRTLRRITIKDAAAAERIFELLMGNEVAPRKEFIATADIDRERIDA